MTTHVLIIKSVEAVTDDDTGLTIDFSYDIDIECPGVTDACAEWSECGVGGCKGSDELVESFTDHGVEHRDFDGTWMTRTGFCWAENHGHAVAEEVAGRLKLGAGRYVVDPDFDDGELIDLRLLTEVDHG